MCKDSKTTKLSNNNFKFGRLLSPLLGRVCLIAILPILLFLSSFQLQAQCPVIQFEDLRGVIGFPQFDNTSQCGQPDTLSILIFTDAPGQILGFDLTMILENGTEYGGFADTHFGGGTSIAYAGGTPTKPSFSLSGVTDPDNVMVANIAIGANCDLDLSNLYGVSFEYEYIYQDTLNNIIDCEGTFNIAQELNSALKRPELNMNTVSPLTRTVSSLGNPYCQTMIVSQDGLQASVEEMQFSVSNFPTIDPNAAIVSIRANSIALPFTIDGDSTVSAIVDGSYFVANSSPNPADENFNTAEKITFEVCYQSDFCPTTTVFNPVYEAWYGCNDDICNSTSQTATVKIQPSGAANPIATVSFNDTVQICGNAGTIFLTLNNPGAAGFENTYTDVSIGYETCERTNLGIAEVRVAGTVLSSSDYDWVGDDLTVHFDSLGMIPGSGLTDADGDGFFDDLEGGATVTLEIDMEILCGVTEVDPTSLDCPSINCPFATFFVKANSNCGNTFNRFPPVDAFNLNYGPTAVSNENEVNIGSVSNPVLGYNFGLHGANGSVSSPNILPPATIPYEFCYEFAAENIEGCASGADYGLKLTFSGEPSIVQDYEVVPGSITYSADGEADVPIADANAVFMTPDPAEPGIRMLTVSGGAANDMVCYKMEIQLDTAFCSPIQYIAVSQQVTEYCSDCACTIVKACKNTQFASDPSYYNCPCVIGRSTEVTRKNLGYTDHTMTTKVDRQTILDNCPADLTNFGPGDTIAICVSFDIKDISAVTNMNMLAINTQMYSTSGARETEELPLTPDRRAGGIVKWEVVKAGGTPVEFSFGDFAECDSRTGNIYNTTDERNGQEIQQGFPAYVDYGLQDLTTEFDVPNAYPGNSSLDGYDNSVGGPIYIRNATQSNECGAVTTSSGGNCLQAFFDAFDFQVGDTIKMYLEYPMKRNPYRAMAIANGENPPVNNSMGIYSYATLYKYDEYGNSSYCYTNFAGACGPHAIVNVAEYGGVSALTELDLDNCGGAARHTFKVTNPPPTGWYQCEFRPIADIDDVDVPMFGPFAFCDNAEVTDYDGAVTSVTVDSTINAYCTTVASVAGEICATDSIGLGDGKVVFDLSSQGIRSLGVGLMNDDSITLSYDLCALCPTAFTIDYELIYDWSDICDAPRNPAGYRCSGSEVYDEYNYCFETPFFVSGNWYVGYDLDTIMYELDESSKDFIVNDNRVPDAGMSSSNEGSDLIASDSPGTSIEYQEFQFCNADGTATQMNVGGSVTIPNSVRFMGAFSDALGTMPLTTALVSDDGVFKSYSITTDSTTLAPGNCETVYIATTLLFCPTLPAPPPQICVSAISGCSAPDVTAALAGSGTCGSSEDCYAYTSGEADLQTEWYNTPRNADLCMTDTFYVRVKNTKQLTLLNLETTIKIPPGVNIVPGSWEAAYPGGQVGLSGNFGPWMAISPQPSPDGLSYSFVDDDYSAEIVNSGLPGVFAGADSNNVSFRFIVTTECDNFISGSKFTTESSASDPCGPNRLMSGLVESPPLIINGADPRDNAQIITTAQPKESFCTGGPSTFGLTALNISENPTSDSVQTCLTIPMGDLTYVSGSVYFTSPSYTPNQLREDTIGSDVVVCFDSPTLDPGQKFSLQFMGDQPESAECGPTILGMDVKSFEPSVVCATAPGMSCGVFVQNSINPSIILEAGPPLKTLDVRLNRQCNAGTDPERFCYEIDLYNPGAMNYTGDIRVGIHDDVLADGLYDAIVDTELEGFDHLAVSADAGDTITISMCLDIPSAQACPVLLRQSFMTACACDEFTVPFDNIPPAFLDTVECVVLCAGEAFMTDICGDYVFTLEPAEGGTITSDGSTLSVTINSGFGVDAPVVLKATEGIGDCVSEATLELKSTGDYMPMNLAFQVCEGECIDPDLMIPENISEGSTIEITQVGTATMGDDLDMSDPEVCGVTPGSTDTYTVTITASPTCIYTFDFTVEVLPIGVLMLTSDEVCIDPTLGATIEAETGFDNYQFFEVLPNGAEVLKQAGAENTFNTDVEGDYVVKATRAADFCPSKASVNASFDHCVDLALRKDFIAPIPGTPAIGEDVTYRIWVFNQGGQPMSQVTVTDSIPLGLTLSASDVNWSPNLSGPGDLITSTINTPLNPGDSLFVDLLLTVLPGANASNTINYAEISGMVNDELVDVSDQDIDSTPDTDMSNDAGGSPEDAEDGYVDGDGTGSPLDGNAAGDEDDHDPATFPIFDLALTKTIDPASIPADGLYENGDTISYFISVINQGTVDATDIEIYDIFPCGFSYVQADNPGWSAASTYVSANSDNEMFVDTTLASLPAGSTIQIPITFYIKTNAQVLMDCMAGQEPYVNFSQIESANDDMGAPANDIDSEAGSDRPEEFGSKPNSGDDNDINSTGFDQTGSEDDHDPAGIAIFDLALTKMLMPDENPYQYGDTATFEICVVNQGSIPTDSVNIVDYIPAGYAYLPSNNSNGWSYDGTNANYAIDDSEIPGGTLEFLEQICVDIDLAVIAPTNGISDYINVAEISSATTVIDTGAGGFLSSLVTSDNDGFFDSDSMNDPGGEVNGNTDDTILGENGDEDDADPATIEIVDFALTKTINSPTGPYAVGDTITFDINIYNQGSVIGQNLTIYDHSPLGLEYINDAGVNPNWSPGSPNSYTYNPQISPGDSATIQIKLVLSSAGMTSEDYVNYAEIGGVFDEDGNNITNDDVDSQPDATLGDAGGEPEGNTDNTILGENGDEDDHDPAFVEYVDMALTKQVIPQMDLTYGDTVAFVINTINQGSVPTTNVVVYDYLPGGLTFIPGAINDEWSFFGTHPGGVTYSTTIMETILPGETVMDTIYLRLESGTGAEMDYYLNIAEIGMFEDTMNNDITLLDLDSPGDSDPGNDSGGEAGGDTDDTVDGENGDEDNADPAMIEIVDFALKKYISAPTGPYKFGDTITFEIVIYNQGNVAGKDFLIYDTAPSNLELVSDAAVNPGWSGSPLGSYTHMETIQPGDSDTIEVKHIILAGGTSQASYTNVAEIGEVFDEDNMEISDQDVDSDPDFVLGDPGGEAGGDTDNTINGENGDEDDSDPAFVRVVDMALTKTVIDGSPYSYGDTVSFVMTTINQGSVPTTGVVINDYVPEGFYFDIGLNPGWDSASTPEWTNTYSHTILDTIYPSEMVMDTVHMILEMTAGGDDAYTNIAEIAMIQDTDGNDVTDEDLDSPGDGDPFNDAGGEAGGDTDNTVNGENGDEDNADPAKVDIIDFALIKTIASPGPHSIGDTITYDIRILNQGNTIGENFVVYDFAPFGLEFINSPFVNPDWTSTMIAGGTFSTYNYRPSINPGDTALVQIKHIVTPNGIDSDDYKNIAEIRSFDDEDGDPVIEDIDSTPDGLPTDPGADPDTGTDNTVNNENGDEDDHDPAIVEIVDMALKKTVVTPGPYGVGDTIEFEMTVFNQGNIPMDSIVVNDYIPSGYTFDNSGTNSEWTSVNDSLYQTMITGALSAKDSTSVFINLVINAVSADADQYLNISELSSFQDDKGEDRTADDQDSEADDMRDNDGGGEEGSAADNDVDGDGTGTGGPSDPETDEDDQDPARIEIVDFALTKSVSSPMAPFGIGDTITFDITLYNQGTVTGENIVIYDSSPIGFTFEPSLNPTWLEGSGMDADSTVYAGPLAPLASDIVQLKLIVNAMGTGIEDYTNYAEIGSVEDEDGNDISEEDQDSTPDDDPTDDAGGEPDGESDDAIDGDGSGDSDSDDADTDEDDHDPALVEIVDMALKKTIVTPGPYGVGDTIEFEMTVFNQGNIPMDSIVVNDYIPSGYTFDNSGTNSEWTSVNDSLYQTMITGALSAKDSTSVFINLVINAVSADADQYLNISELSSFKDADGNDRTADDQDSEADDMRDNDGGGEEGSAADNDVDGDGTGTGGPSDPETDEDDQDPARIEIVDFALTKSVSSPMAPFGIGDTITFDITLYNQGTVTGENIVIYDSSPIGFTFEPSLNPTWLEGSGMDADSTVYAGPLAPLASDIVQLKLIVNAMGTGIEDYTNYAEIGSVEDEDGNDISEEDQDSTPDDDPTDDAGGEPDGESDDAIDGDGSGDSDSDDADTDEDDHDPAIVEIVDMALKKTVVTPGPYGVGDTIEFEMTVFNQGNIPMDSIVVNDYIPSGYTFDNSGTNSEWTSVNDSLYQTMITGALSAKDSTSVFINLVINAVSADADQYLNISELSSFQDEKGEDRTADDQDSEADDMRDNDGGGEEGSAADNDVDGDGTGTGGPSDPETDEDDQDPARIEIVDFALTKSVSSPMAPFGIGDTITFDITLYNQGTVTGENIVIYDSSPIGFTFEPSLNPTWLEGSGMDADSTVYAGPLAPLASDVVQLKLIVNAMGTGIEDYTNYAEIGSVEDEDGNDISEEDQDSTPDDDPTDDAGGEPDGESDDAIDGDGSGDSDSDDADTDEDDHDPALVEIVDMALKKTVVTPGPYGVGDTIEFEMTVFNQGNIPMDSIVVNDYIPSGYTFDNSGTNSEWTSVNDSLYQTMITGALSAKDSTSVFINLVINAVSADADQYLNISELSSFKDADGNDRTADDQDSEADDMRDNDGGGEEGSAADNDVDGDGTGAGGPSDPGTDEDDQDPARIEIVDFALTKSVSSPMAPFGIGDTITFDITLYNQGTVTGENIVIYDSSPIGFTFEPSLNPTWLEGSGMDADSTVYAGPLAPLASDIVQMKLIVNAMGTGIEDYTNYAEIGSVEDEDGNDISEEDQDSTPDDDPTDDAGGEPDGESDDAIDGDGSGDSDSDDAETDEDDHDPAIVELVDMALKKTIFTPGPYEFGDTIEFEITVFNQGNIPMDSVLVNDYVPSGLTFDNSGTNSEWSYVNDSLYQTTLVGGIAAKDSQSAFISLVINPLSADEDQYLNISELSSFKDEDGNDRTDDDQDSDADDMPDNDAGGEVNTGSDNSVDGDGSGDPGSSDSMQDEDDADPEWVDVVQIFDLALTKKLNSQTDSLIELGDTVYFDLEVFNQGNIDAYNVQLSDYVPDGLTLIAGNGWTMIGDTARLESPIDRINIGDSATVVISFRVDLGFMLPSITNNAEIESQEDIAGPRDDDDSESGNEDGTTPDEEEDDNDIAEENGDDDYDFEIIPIQHRFDLALIKYLDPTTPMPIIVGGDVRYNLVVFNQGTLDAYDTYINDYVPPSLILNDDNWVMDGDTAKLINPIEFIGIGESDTLTITMTIDALFNGGTIVNNAEISQASDIMGPREDDDSTPGNQGGNAPDEEDDDIANENGNDDYDPESLCAVLFVCPDDLSLPSCMSQREIEFQYNVWLEKFKAEGCGHFGRVESELRPPLSCGGAVTVTWQLLDSATMTVSQTCQSTFKVLADVSGPICPSDWNITVSADSDICYVEPYNDVSDLNTQTGQSVMNNCLDPATLNLTYSENLMPADCNGSENGFFESRTIVRSYSITNECGNVRDICNQEIRYEFDECVTLTDFGTIGFGASNFTTVPVDCDVPEIEVVEEEQGVCGYVEYMWLVSTQVDENNRPYIPTDDNIGTIWLLMPNEIAPTLSPGKITETTYYVRCARNFACCSFGESNIVAAVFDENVSCGGIQMQINEKCDSTIVLLSPDNDFMQKEQMMYITDEGIEAGNITGQGASLSLNSGKEIIMNAGFEVRDSALLEVYNKGCKE